jgi:septal ring factor EnvC (AmiA/AmiB activator)
MRFLLLAGLVLGFAGCESDTTVDRAREAQSDPEQEARQRARDELTNSARERADKLHAKIGNFNEQLAAAEQELAAAKTEEERKAAEAKVRALKAKQGGGGDDEPPPPTKRIELHDTDKPLGR